MTRKNDRRSRSHRSCLGRSRRYRSLAALVTGATTFLGIAGSTATAQQSTFHLDRVEVPGSPDDSFVLFRPYTRQSTIFFAQLGLGYSLNPLHTANVTSDQPTINASKQGVVSDQFTSYANIGFEFLDRFILGLALPVTWFEDGQNPKYSQGTVFGGAQGETNVNTSGPAVGDTRLDLRGVIWRSENRKAAFGAQVSVFFPTGTNYNFGGDGSTTAMVLLNGEYSTKIIVPVTFVANTGVMFRPETRINSPPGNGLGIGSEWRWAIGAFVPIAHNKFRVGATIFGQTGIADGNISGNTFFTAQNTPIEWQAEGRMKFGPLNRFWCGVGAGTLILNGYGAPDFRIMGMAGIYVPILDSSASSPDPKVALRQKWRSQMVDTDHDGIPDDLDACPNDPEDHKGNDPNDGCPELPDRDGDGIPDQYDKCPDQPEDKDGIDDTDGCPEDDADQDGIPDTADACPKEPGSPSPDPKKNGCPQFIHLEGSVVRVLQQVHFATASATILPDSFPMLQEIANLLKANPQIKRMTIDGHTDNRGDAAMNKRLSDARAKSVMSWLVQHGVVQERLEAHGYGLERPIVDNATAEGRAANRRVEFKILDEDTDAPKPAHHTQPEPEEQKDDDPDK